MSRKNLNKYSKDSFTILTEQLDYTIKYLKEVNEMTPTAAGGRETTNAFLNVVNTPGGSTVALNRYAPGSRGNNVITPVAPPGQTKDWYNRWNWLFQNWYNTNTIADPKAYLNYLYSTMKR